MLKLTKDIMEQQPGNCLFHTKMLINYLNVETLLNIIISKERKKNFINRRIVQND